MKKKPFEVGQGLDIKTQLFCFQETSHFDMESGYIRKSVILMIAYDFMWEIFKY